MSKNELIKKNLQLSADLSSYLINHPEKADILPSGTCVVFEVSGDKEFSDKNRKIAEKILREGKRCYVAEKRKDDWKFSVVTTE